MTQSTHWELLLDIDEHGTGLNENDLILVSYLIDSDREGLLTHTEMRRIRELHKRTVRTATENDDDTD